MNSFLDTNKVVRKMVQPSLCLRQHVQVKKNFQSLLNFAVFLFYVKTWDVYLKLFGMPAIN